MCNELWDLPLKNAELLGSEQLDWLLWHQDLSNVCIFIDHKYHS